jgi:hypothetical protein
LTTDLCSEEEMKDHYLTQHVELISFEVVK